MSRSRQSGFAHLVLILVLVAVVLGVGAFAVIRSKRLSKQIGSDSWKSGCKGDQRVMLSHTPMDLADIDTIMPMGLTAGAHVTPIDHLYYYPKAKERDAVPVYAMADGAIIEISERTQMVDTGKNRPAEYRLVFQHSCQTISYFDLVTSLDPDIMKQWKSQKLGTRINVKAGQVIGRIGGQSLDTAVYNLNLTLPGFLHPAMYTSEPWKIHADDFFSYFEDPLKSQFLAINQRKILPYSGKIDYDQAGKLIGNWFIQGTNGYAGPAGDQKPSSNGKGYWTGHLSIHYDPIDGKSIVVSIGEFGDTGQPQAFGVAGNSPDPATISSSSGIVKYDLVAKQPGGAPTQQQDKGTPKTMGVVLFQVQAGEKLKVEIIQGKSSNDVSDFSGATKTYER